MQTDCRHMLPPCAPQAKRVLWGNKDAATSDSTGPRMDYRAFCKYISK
jgi:hypothetical protein